MAWGQAENPDSRRFRRLCESAAASTVSQRLSGTGILFPLARLPQSAEMTVMFLVGLFGVLLKFRQCCGLGRLLKFRQGYFMLSFDIPVHVLTCQKFPDAWSLETWASVLGPRINQT